MARRARRSDCPIHFALQTLGDAWTLLVVRDLMLKGRTTYTDFLHAEEGIATNILADRLRRLEEHAVIRRRGGEFRLTTKGLDLMPVLLDLIEWSAKHDPKTAAEPGFVRALKKDRHALVKKLRAELVAQGHG
jgi:DNA-binding HxlR family transcriptional regulator